MLCINSKVDGMEVSYNRKVFLKKEINIPGICLLGHNKANKALDPLTNHIHENCIEIVVLIKGSESYYAGEKCFCVQGKEAFIAHLNEYHRSSGASQGISEFIWFQIDYSNRQNFLGLGKRNSALLLSKISEYQEHVLTVDDRCLSLLKEIFASVENGQPIYAEGLFASLLYRLFFMMKPENENNILINKAIKYINDNIYDVIEIEDVASFCNVSLSTFKHRFKEQTRKTPRVFINEMKIEKAKELLNGGMSVTETAFALSFNTSDYFSSVFKKYTNRTPRSIKKQLKSVKKEL